MVRDDRTGSRIFAALGFRNSEIGYKIFAALGYRNKKIFRTERMKGRIEQGTSVKPLSVSLTFRALGNRQIPERFRLYRRFVTF